jgi:hypothetical protein
MPGNKQLAWVNKSDDALCKRWVHLRSVIHRNYTMLATHAISAYVYESRVNRAMASYAGHLASCQHDQHAWLGYISDSPHIRNTRGTDTIPGRMAGR